MPECANIAVAILAAGRATRFGSDKLIADLDGIPMGLHIANTIAEIGFGWRFAICKSDAPIAERYVLAGFKITTNAETELGQAHSLQLAVREAQSTSARALLVVLADMPFVTRGHLNTITANDGLTASTDGKAPMPPALFPRALWQDLLLAKGDTGARHLLRSAHLVEAPALELRDIDVIEDLHTPRDL